MPGKIAMWQPVGDIALDDVTYLGGSGSFSACLSAKLTHDGNKAFIAVCSSRSDGGNSVAILTAVPLSPVATIAYSPSLVGESTDTASAPPFVMRVCLPAKANRRKSYGQRSESLLGPFINWKVSDE